MLETAVAPNSLDSKPRAFEILKGIWARRGWALGLGLAVACGILFRLIWPFDIEYKGDEAWMFQKTQTVGVSEPWPLLGMPTCSVFQNPGMNVWVFTGLARLFGVEDPPGLARAVQVLNVTAIILFIVFIFRLIPKEEREPWLWAIALMSLNPIAVLFHRKIWQPSLFPLFSLLFLSAWLRRDRVWGGFLWGLVGACLGQIQMAGFFFAAGFVAWAALFDRRSAHWKSWFAGSVIGSIPLIPWLHYMLTWVPDKDARGLGLVRMFEGKFWTRWATEPFGISMKYSLERDFADFLGFPVIAGVPTYLMLLLHAASIVLAVFALSRAGFYVWRKRSEWWALCVGRQSSTAFTVSAAFWGFGICLTLSTMPVNRHYLLVATPLVFVWLARHVLQDASVLGGLRFGRGMLIAICLTTGLTSATFLHYIHENQRRINGDFGMPYGAQVQTVTTARLNSAPNP